MAKLKEIKSIKVISHKDEVMDRTDFAIEKAMIQCGLKLERYAKELCPVDTGRLRNSINFATHGTQGTGAGTDKPHGSPNKGMVCVGTNVEYAAYQEFGTSLHHESGQSPYLRPAVERHLSEYQKIIADTLGEIMSEPTVG